MAWGRRAILALCALLWTGVPSWGAADAARVAEIRSLLGPDAETPATVLQDASEFRIDVLKKGMNILVSARTAELALARDSRVFFLFHGINEKGDSWKAVLGRLFEDPRNIVLFFKWSKWQRAKPVTQTIARDLARVYSMRISRIVIAAHSAGSVLLLQGLGVNGEPPPEGVEVHLIAGPLGGYGHRLTGLTAPFIGPITAMIGGQPRYPGLAPEMRINLWYTLPGNDYSVRVSKSHDSRFPVFEGPAPEPVLHELSRSTHESAIIDALDPII
jgi:hypothetical protein